MAINFNNPALANTYSNMLADIRDMQTALAVMDFTSATAIPTLTKRWSATNSRFEVWNGSGWGALMPDASTSVRGLVLLNDTVISTSTALGATANSVKTAYDAAVLAASTTVAGRVELATDAETQTGTDVVRAVTPAGLRACTATETRIGVVELATNAEVQTGTDTARAVTPAGLRACTATETRIGVVELATNAEAITGTDTARAVTPSGLSAALRPTTVVGHVRAGNTQIYNGETGYPNGADAFYVENELVEDAWVTVGPTGSGATFIWDAMDNLPATARILIVNADAHLISAHATNQQYAAVYVAAAGVTANYDNASAIIRMNIDDYPVGAATQTIAQQFIPLSSSRVFQCRWTSNIASTFAVTLHYKGFITD